MGTAGLLLLSALGAATVIAIPFSEAAGPDLYLTLVGGVQVVYSALGLIFAAWAGFRADLPPRIRRAWRLMLPTYALWIVVTFLYAVFPGQVFPSPPAIGQLLIQPVTFVGI
ncbi:hypothetical protein [Actinoplanes couchii]|uniref:Acyltransferase n=1 Tax=Actinoplanes couchii TaxID=403638 RepID=A0ABQ3XNI2_9ACTN|nr:hypothetical protein [Actinoplanes couchii]MDR6318010.1 hypothetical protein [Actinoplanes couchii]GID60072.1 hypothetical protein Aco03nite_084760 [Actinoplanes couchii]